MDVYTGLNVSPCFKLTLVENIVSWRNALRYTQLLQLERNLSNLNLRLNLPLRNYSMPRLFALREYTV